MNNGIKQGPILSPYLINVFMDGLNNNLNSTKAGCCIGNNTVNNFSWADDMVVLSPSGPGLNELLRVCDNYAFEHLITYNTKKTKCMYFKAKDCNMRRLPVIVLSGNRIEYVNEFTYLGHVITDDLRDDSDIMSQNRKLCARGNMLVRQFKSCTIDVKRQLFLTFCSTIYCRALWVNFRLLTINRIRVNYNNILRRLVHMPSFTSASQLFSLLDLKGFQELRRRACYGLMTRLRTSKNDLLNVIINSDARLRSNIWETWRKLLYVL